MILAETKKRDMKYKVKKDSDLYRIMTKEERLVSFEIIRTKWINNTDIISFTIKGELNGKSLTLECMNDEIETDYVSNVLDVAKIEGELMYNRYKRLYKK